MPYALCSMPARVPHVTEKGYSTDIHLPSEQIVEYYQARFQIEFIFRDAKQFTGLFDCQARHLPRLDFHFNASLIALNLAKHQRVHLSLANTSN